MRLAQTLPGRVLISEIDGWRNAGASACRCYCSHIAEALAAPQALAFTVKGVVTMVDGKNVYVQDETGGICLYLKAADSSIQLGDTVIGTGAKKVYNGLPELDAATAEKSSGMTLKAKQTTIGALTDADLCTYITIKDLEVLAVADKNITVQDTAGTSINIYKPVLGDKTVAVGDKLDFTGALGTFNGYQLRNTVADEIALKSDVPPEPTYDTIAAALAGAEGTAFTVKGVVTMVDSKNVYVQWIPHSLLRRLQHITSHRITPKKVYNGLPTHPYPEKSSHTLIQTDHIPHHRIPLSRSKILGTRLQKHHGQTPTNINIYNLPR